MTEIIIRNYSPVTDDPYIYSTWTKYAWYSPKEPIGMSKRKFFHEKIKYIRHVLENQKSIVRTACMKDDPDTIMGYVVAYDGELEWICVKKTFIESGIKELLLKSIEGNIYGTQTHAKSR